MTCPCVNPDASMTACAVSLVAARWCVVYADGTVRWLAMHWHGLPMPLRVCGVVRGLWTWREAKRLPGCGCSVLALAWCASLARAFARFARTSAVPA